jgi:hypothetical protein
VVSDFNVAKRAFLVVNAGNRPTNGDANCQRPTYCRQIADSVGRAWAS